MLCRIGTRTIKNFFKTAGTSSVPKLQGSGWCSGFSAQCHSRGRSLFCSIPIRRFAATRSSIITRICDNSSVLSPSTIMDVRLSSPSRKSVDTEKKSAIFISISIEGWIFPFSQFEILCLDTLSFSPSSTWLMPRTLRSSLMLSPNMACSLPSLLFLLCNCIFIRIHAPYTAGLHTDFGFYRKKVRCLLNTTAAVGTILRSIFPMHKYHGIALVDNEQLRSK